MCIKVIPPVARKNCFTTCYQHLPVLSDRLSHVILVVVSSAKHTIVNQPIARPTVSDGTFLAAPILLRHVVLFISNSNDSKSLGVSILRGCIPNSTCLSIYKLLFWQDASNNKPLQMIHGLSSSDITTTLNNHLVPSV